MRYSIISLAILLSFTLVAQETNSSAPQAEEAPQKPKIRDEIVVTATRSERQVSDLPVSTTVVTEKEIESAPAVAVDDVLRTVPGVQTLLQGSMNHGTPTSSRFSMRGLGGTRALVLLDGIPMHDPVYGTVQWQKVPLDTIRRMEVVRGGSAGLFGNYALGGTINLLTRPVDESAIRLDGAFGNMDTQRQSVTVDHLVNGKLGLRFSHNRFDSDGFLVEEVSSPVNIPAWSDLSAYAARAEYQATETARGFLKLNWSEAGISLGSPLSKGDRDILDVSTGLQSAAGSAGLLVTTLFYSTTNEDFSRGGFPPGGLTTYLEDQGTIPGARMGGSGEWTKQLRGSVPFVTIGVDFQQLQMEEDSRTFNSAGAVTQDLLLHGRQRFVALFGQASWQPSERLEVLGTFRIDHYRNIDGRETKNGQATAYPDSTTTEIDPRVSFRYSLGPHIALRGAAYRAFKAPTLRELYRSTQVRSAIILPNPDLEPERLIGAEVGTEWAASRTRVAVNLYRNEIDGLQVRAPIQGMPPNYSRAINIGRIRAQGIEVMGDFDLSQRWSVEAGYTYADSVVTEDANPSLEGKLVPEVPRHAGSLSVRFRSDRGTSLDVRGRVLGRSYADAPNAAITPAHRILDISLSHPVREWLDAYVAIENVLDADYYYAVSTQTRRNGRPRGVLAGIRMRIPTGGTRVN